MPRAALNLPAIRMSDILARLDACQLIAVSSGQLFDLRYSNLGTAQGILNYSGDDVMVTYRPTAFRCRRAIHAQANLQEHSY